MRNSGALSNTWSDFGGGPETLASHHQRAGQRREKVAESRSKRTGTRSSMPFTIRLSIRKKRKESEQFGQEMSDRGILYELFDYSKTVGDH